LAEGIGADDVCLLTKVSDYSLRRWIEKAARYVKEVSLYFKKIFIKITRPPPLVNGSEPPGGFIEYALEIPKVRFATLQKSLQWMKNDAK